jgi:hypothetical protein
MEPKFLTAWERDDYERKKRGEPERGPTGPSSPSWSGLSDAMLHEIALKAYADASRESNATHGYRIAAVVRALRLVLPTEEAITAARMAGKHSAMVCQTCSTVLSQQCPSCEKAWES